jgi:hypothetical protein
MLVLDCFPENGIDHGIPEKDAGHWDGEYDSFWCVRRDGSPTKLNLGVANGALDVRK